MADEEKKLPSARDRITPITRGIFDAEKLDPETVMDNLPTLKQDLLLLSEKDDRLKAEVETIMEGMKEIKPVEGAPNSMFDVSLETELAGLMERLGAVIQTINEAEKIRQEIQQTVAPAAPSVVVTAPEIKKTGTEKEDEAKKLFANETAEDTLAVLQELSDKGDLAMKKKRTRLAIKTFAKATALIIAGVGIAVGFYETYKSFTSESQIMTISGGTAPKHPSEVKHVGKVGGRPVVETSLTSYLPSKPASGMIVEQGPRHRLSAKDIIAQRKINHPDNKSLPKSSKVPESHSNLKSKAQYLETSKNKIKTSTVEVRGKVAPLVPGELFGHPEAEYQALVAWANSNADGLPLLRKGIYEKVLDEYINRFSYINKEKNLLDIANDVELKDRFIQGLFMVKHFGYGNFVKSEDMPVIMSPGTAFHVNHPTGASPDVIKLDNLSDKPSVSKVEIPTAVKFNLEAVKSTIPDKFKPQIVNGKLNVIIPDLNTAVPVTPTLVDGEILLRVDYPRLPNTPSDYFKITNGGIVKVEISKP